MALSNKERVGRILDALTEGLAPFVIREYRATFGQRFAMEMADALRTSSYELPEAALSDLDALAQSLDTYNTLNLMIRNWREVFHDKLGHVGRNWVGELLSARNDWAHGQAFDNDQAYRVADTARRLLEMISAAEPARTVDAIAGDLLRLRYEREAEKARKEAQVSKTEEVTTLAGLKPWRDVVSPHPDVAGGRYLQAEFVADLSQVIAGTAEPEYADPVEFFRRTYLTEGLEEMLVTGIKRLTAQGGDPVVQLKTSFGGGKTHSMLALYHLCSGQLSLEALPGGERLAKRVGNVDLPEANRAVLVGTALSVNRPRHYGDVAARTLWGELACQLGQREGRTEEAYALVAADDEKGVSPNADTLVELLDRFGPCLLVIDEFVAYARNIYGVEGLPSGSFDSVMTFMQALTEAVRRSSDSMLLVSLPESEIEVGGKAGQEALEILSHIVGRIESVWKPVTATESFEIVRRRLFGDDVDYAARDAVLEAFGDMYRNASAEFPSETARRDYITRMQSAYPIHPEMFDRLYEDWSTLERFQRTRGVLRLMAAVIHQLWERGDKSLLIMPGTLPLAANPVRNELLRYLPDTWTGVFDRDVDGDKSQPLEVDRTVPALGRYNAARRVARTVFLGSAPSVAAQRVRGLEEIRIRLGSAQPGEPTAIFGDALRRLSSQLTYLYTDGTRYWYDTRPTVAKEARDRAAGFSPEVVEKEIVERLQRVPRRGTFAGHHVAPPGTGDVTDEDRVRVVVLRPEFVHRRTTATTAAEERAQAFLERRGNQSRLYKNMLLFIAPDENIMESLNEAVRNFLAWRSIQDDEEALNLDAQQRRQVQDSLQKWHETVDLRLQEAYCWLLTPVKPEALGETQLQANRISGEDNFYERASRKLRQDGLLVDVWSPDILRMELDNYYWGQDRAWQTELKKLWQDLAQHPYFPRLLNQQVLVDAVRDGVRRVDAPFAYATGMDDEGYHTGVVYRQGGSVYFDENSLLVHPEHVNKRPPPQPPVGPGDGTGTWTGTGTGTGTGVGPGPTPPSPPPPKTSRYYGRVQVDAQRVHRELETIVDEVLQHLTSLPDADVNVTLEINARNPQGFDDTTVRTVSENSCTLKFDQFGFEKE